uniref:ENTH domain containing 1 n=1 Tax=Nannospalax galili TaxID=1026970 RepID=A0A8C6RGX9_NANGA
MAFRRQVKNFVKNYSDAEIKVREATSNDPWGPSSSLMLAIRSLSQRFMHMLWQRLSDHGRNWRHMYKSLILMDYLIKNGSKKVIQCCREGFCNLRMLKDFQHIDEAGKDQDRYIRGKSKQVITLMYEQMPYREREVASWTRQCTSYSMTLPSRFPGAENSPTACASALIVESPASAEKKQLLLKTTSLCNKKNASKARLQQELCQDVPLPAGTVPPKDSPQLRTKMWKSTEDLTLLHDEYPKQLSFPIPPSITSPASWLSEEGAEVCNLWDADAVSMPSEKSPLMQTNMNLDKRLKEAITNITTETPLQILQEKQAAELISLSLRTSKSESTSHGQSSVETLYTSPSSKHLTSTCKDLLTGAQPSIGPVDDGSLKPLAMRSECTPKRANSVLVSTTSEGISSVSTLSVSSPDSAHPEKSPLFLDSAPSAVIFRRQDPPPLPSQGHTSSRCQQEPGSVFHPDRGPLPVAVTFLLGEVKSAVVRLHEDLSLVIRGLSVINSHLGSLGGSSPAASQSPEGGSERI